MIRFITLFLCFAPLLYAGGLPEVSEEEEKNVIADSDTVFEAIFVEQKVSYWLGGKEMTRKEVYGKMDKEGLEGTGYKAKIRREITLLVTDSIKGALKKHQIFKITVNDHIVSMCPHIMNYGDYQAKQVYYISGVNGKKNYRYRTVRKAVDFRLLRDRNRIHGVFQERMGKTLEIAGKLIGKKKGELFTATHDEAREYFRGVKLGSEISREIGLELDPKFSASGGRIPELGKQVILEGYESIVAHPFSDEKELTEANPFYDGDQVLEIVFMVTKVRVKTKK